MQKADASDFGRRLRELREEAGLTQVQLAEKAGLHPQGLIKLEREEREPAWATVIALADALGVSCESFRRKPVAEHPNAIIGRPAKSPPAEQPAAKRLRSRDPVAAGAASPGVPPVDVPAEQAAAGPRAKKRPGQPHAAPADFETGKKRTRRKK